MKRKALSKKTRFEIFKRDGFVCQYCGSHPPSVILHVDHIIPVAGGGVNDMDNLITACEACNQGKSARSLSDIPQSLKEKSLLIKEREAQINGYQELINQTRMRIEREVSMVCDLYERLEEGYTLTEKSLMSVKRFIELIGVYPVLGAMETAYTMTSVRKANKFRYFCGICWNLIRDQSNGTR